ncbi:MAG: hypothetical protein V4548_11205 [Bacteroidota bacterium]
MSVIKANTFLMFFLFLSVHLTAQKVIKEFKRETISMLQLQELKTQFSINKIIPEKYESQILIALSYFPELKDTSIEFRLQKTNTPLSSRPSFFGLLQSSKKRKYYIVISEMSNSKLQPILIENLSFNAQIGVLGHELSHISDYLTKGFIKMNTILCIEIFSKKQVDSFEQKTDKICIYHGLGYQLLEWSTAVRNNLKIDNWRGANNIRLQSKKERYLNPETIIKFIETLPFYKE